MMSGKSGRTLTVARLHRICYRRGLAPACLNLPVTGDRQSTDLTQDVHACGALETLPVYRHTVGMVQRQTGLCADLSLPLLVH